MLVLTAGIMAIVCATLIGFGCWWPPREEQLTVAAIQRRLDLEKRHQYTPLRTIRADVEPNRHCARPRLQGIDGAGRAGGIGDTTNGGSRTRGGSSGGGQLRMLLVHLGNGDAGDDRHEDGHPSALGSMHAGQ